MSSPLTQQIEHHLEHIYRGTEVTEINRLATELIELMRLEKVEPIKNRYINHWDEKDILEIMSVISLFGYLNRWNDVMGTSLEEDAKDSAESLLQSKWNIGKHAT